MRATSIKGARLTLRTLATTLCATAALTLGFCLLQASPAAAAEPWWHLTTNVRPANIAPGGEGVIVLQAVNVGDGVTSGPITLSDVLPPNVKVQEEEVEGALVPKVSFFAFSLAVGQFDLALLGACESTTASVSCRSPEFLAPLQPYEDLEVRISVKDEGAASGEVNKSEVKGGSASAVSLKRPVRISSTPPAFGAEAESFAMAPEEEGGAIDTQAGSHPYQLTTSFALNQNSDPKAPPALARNLKFNLPAGLIGNATLLPQCSDLDFRHVVEGGEENLCPADTALGVASVTVDEPLHVGLSTLPVPLFNLEPEKGEPARFGFEVVGAPVTLDTSVRTGSDYGVSVSVNNISQLAAFLSSTVSFWGVPGDSSHDNARGWTCLVGGHWTNEAGRGLPCLPSSQSHPAPFLTMPTSCTNPFIASVEGLSWATPSSPGGVGFSPLDYTLQDSFGRTLGVSGCNQLAFDPSIEAQPDVQTASTPTGLSVHVRVPQEVSLGAGGLASSSIKDTSVTLPEGVTLNPAGADGLQACSESEVGFGSVAGDGTDLFTPTLPSPFCPDASKIGNVEFKVPVIAHPLKGAVYLATQNANPFGSLVAMYIVAEDPTSGVLIKLAGEVSLSSSGRVTTTFRNSPQAPLEEATFSFFGGSRAPLATPSHCGAYTTQATFTPWSETPPVSASSTFNITSGPNGGPCPSSLPFAPTLAAGTTNIQAGAFSPLVTTISREDGNQDIQTVQLHMPAGLSGVLKGVALCPEAQANAGTCGPESEIGSTIVSVGLGGDPFTVTGGKVFLTETYKGAPFGLSIVNPAKAGPFDLGKVIVRAKLEIDPLTAAITVTTDQIPHILDGIPLQIKHVSVTINRAGGFTFNPTNCAASSISGAIGSVEGASAAVSSPFQITNCAALKFAPKFSASTAGKTSKSQGASLSVKLTYPNAPFGTYANLAKAKVSLPKQLPSRLTTLQKACTAAVFNANPAKCPPESIVGHAKVITPLLPVPLTGPAYFVSHGGEAFPDLTMVLQGYGVTVELIGSTSIKGGVTTSTFKATPDVPFNSFELTLPQGKFSALAANAGQHRVPEARRGPERLQEAQVTDFLPG
jgi:hypothetical protein